MSSVMAAMQQKTEQEEAEIKAFNKMAMAAKPLTGQHRQRPIPKSMRKYIRTDNRLYTVTTIAASARYGGTRTPGIFTTFQKAIDCVLNNYVDIYECSYRLACVEAVVPNGLYSLLFEQYWFRWVGTPDAGRYVPIRKPKNMSNGFAIG